MAWYFYLWMMVILKIPIVALLYIVWWASREPEPVDPEPARISGDRHPFHPRTPRHPRRPRRGPHADPLPLPPSRVRSVRGRRIPSHGH